MKKVARRDYILYNFSIYEILLEKNGVDRNGNGIGIVTIFRKLGTTNESFVLWSYKVFTNALIPHENDKRDELFAKWVKQAELDYYG